MEWHVISRILLYSIIDLLAILVDFNDHSLLRLAGKLPLLVSLELLNHLAYLYFNMFH